MSRGPRWLLETQRVNAEGLAPVIPERGPLEARQTMPSGERLLELEIIARALRAEQAEPGSGAAILEELADVRGEEKPIELVTRIVRR